MISRRAIPAWLTLRSWSAPDGWQHRSFVAEPAGPVRGNLLFLGGRGDFIEKYLEAIAHWHGQGWRVSGFDWRGQGGSGRFLADPLICHSLGFDRLLDDLDAFVAEWAQAPGPRAAVAHSMGAHLLLRLAAERAPAIDAAALCAPMFGIAARPLPGWALPPVAALARLAGRAEQPIWRRADRHRGITSSLERHEDKLWWKATLPEIASGPPSWGWLGCALASLRALDAALTRRSPELPMLVIGSRRDPIIDVVALARTTRRLPRAELRMLDQGGHELLREADLIRLPVLTMIDDFLARSASARG